MTVQAIYAGVSRYTVSGVGYAPEGKILREDKPVALNSAKALQECLTVGVLCNDSHLSRMVNMGCHGRSTEGALVAAANKAGLIQSTRTRDAEAGCYSF